MATSSIFESVKITDPAVAEAFVGALESSQNCAIDSRRSNQIVKMASKSDIKRFRALNSKRTGLKG